MKYQKRMFNLSLNQLWIQLIFRIRTKFIINFKQQRMTFYRLLELLMKWERSIFKLMKLKCKHNSIKYNKFTDFKTKEILHIQWHFLALKIILYDCYHLLLFNVLKCINKYHCSKHSFCLDSSFYYQSSNNILFCY